MKKVLLATEKPFVPIAVNGIKKIFNEVNYELLVLEEYNYPADLLEAITNVDGLIVRSDKITKEIVEAGKNLKIIVRAGAGYDNIDLKSAAEKGIVVMNTPGQNANAVAELTIGMMLFASRGFFRGKPGVELKGKKLGLQGFGYIGKRVAKIAKGFDMEIYTYDPFLTKEVAEKEEDVKWIERIENLYRECQYISLHIPANEETEKSINYNLLSLMPKEATLINTARKEIICEESLKKMFQLRPDFKYLTDVAPDCQEELLTKYPDRYYATPKKQGAETLEANINAGLAAANQIVNFFEKGNKTFQVN